MNRKGEMILRRKKKGRNKAATNGTSKQGRWQVWGRNEMMEVEK